MNVEHFFDITALPQFIAAELSKDEWYRLVAKFIEVAASMPHSGVMAEGVFGSGHITCMSSAKIAPGCVIEGPVYIGERVKIAPHAHIRPGSIILDDCEVGHAAEVKNSLMLPGSKISNHSFLGDSIMGSKARLGGHCETTNRRFDQGEIAWQFEQNPVNFGATKLGLILGDESRLGGGVLTSPGSVIGKKSFVETGVAFGGFLPGNKYIKNKQQFEIRDNKFDGTLT